LISEKDKNAKSLLSLAVSYILHPDVVILDQFQTAADAIIAMKEHSSRSVLISDRKKQIIGLVSKTDIIYKVLSLHKHREDIIMKMERAIVETTNAFKIDTPLCIMDPFASASISENKSILVCPHCQMEYKDKDLLSKHVKAIHSSTRI